MNGRLIRSGLMAAALAALCVSGPAFADGHGRGHAGGGFAAARGGHSMPRGAAPRGGRMAAGPSRGGSFSVPHAARPTISRPSIVRPPTVRPPTHSGFTAVPRGRYSSNRDYSSPRYAGGSRFATPAHNYAGNSRNYTGRPGFYRPTHPTRGIGFNHQHRYWAGGYFHGRYWPRSYYHHGFVPFVTVLPAFYSTFWFGGIPYYYWDDTYYMWSPSEYGYVATDPPPAAADDSSDEGSAQVESSDPSTLYVYPKNGQSEEQTATDRYQCHEWASGQTGFDPTKGADQSAASSGPSDYRRAMMACLEARGYSAR
jgi:hypothetical protein